MKTGTKMKVISSVVRVAQYALVGFIVFELAKGSDAVISAVKNRIANNG